MQDPLESVVMRNDMSVGYPFFSFDVPPVCRCLSLVAFGVRFSLWAPSPRPALFWRYPLGYVSSLRRVGSIVRMPRQVLGLRVVVRAVNSAHAP